MRYRKEHSPPLRAIIEHFASSQPAAMSQYFEIHPVNPQTRLVHQAAEILRAGGVAVYPTDSCYAIGCTIGNKAAQERMRQIRHLDDVHHFSLVCRDLSEIATYAKVDDVSYRLMKGLTPGPYTFLLPATREVPRRLQNPKRKSIGLRVPDNRIVQALLEELGEPLMSSTLLLLFGFLLIFAAAGRGSSAHRCAGHPRTSRASGRSHHRRRQLRRRADHHRRSLRQRA